jgi:hypothetical protein
MALGGLDQTWLRGDRQAHAGTSRPLSLTQAGGLYTQLYELQARAYRKGRAGA